MRFVRVSLDTIEIVLLSSMITVILLWKISGMGMHATEVFTKMSSRGMEKLIL